MAFDYLFFCDNENLIPSFLLAPCLANIYQRVDQILDDCGVSGITSQNSEINECKTKRSTSFEGRSDNEPVNISETHLAYVDWSGIQII